MRRRSRPRRAGLALCLLTSAVALPGCGGAGSTDSGYGPPGATTTTGDAAPATPAPGGTMTEQSHGAGDVITVTAGTDLAGTLRLGVGEEATLRLEPPLQEVAPAVSDASVLELVPVDHLVDPGYAEYQLLALAPGRAALTLAQTDDHPEDVVLEVVVDGG